MLPHGAASVDQHVEAILRTTRGGRNLCNLHYDSDIVLCSLNSILNIVPKYDSTQGLLF